MKNILPNILLKTALKSPHSFRHGAILVGRNEIIVTGYNNNFTHAEVSAYRKGNRRRIL